MSDERLDQLIDDVARQMTRGQLSSDFRARVIASLDRHPRRGWRPIWIAAPLGTLAVAVLAIVIAQPFKGRDRGPGALQPSRQAATVETATVPPTAAAATTAVDRPDTPYRSTSRRTYRPSDAAAAVDALAPPPLEPVSIGVAALGIDALPTESIAVRQLDAIAPIVVNPLPTDRTIDDRP